MRSEGSTSRFALFLKSCYALQSLKRDRRSTVEGGNWDVGVNWDRILVTRHLCYCSLRDTGVQFYENVVHCDPCDCVLLLI